MISLNSIFVTVILRNIGRKVENIMGEMVEVGEQTRLDLNRIRYSLPSGVSILLWILDSRLNNGH